MKTLLKLALLIVLALALVAGLVVTLRTGAEPELEIRPELTAIGARTPVVVTATAPGRGLADLRLELVTANRVYLIAERTYQPLPPWGLSGDHTERDEIRADVGRETLPDLKEGEAVLRATAGRARTWLAATDDVRNRAEMVFVDRFFPKPPAHDTIRLSESFMARVVPEILRRTPDLADRGDLLENYLQVNRDLRQTNAAALVDLALGSAPDFLWNQPFLPFPNAKVMSAFADQRTYMFEGREVDQQTHLGYDLASVAQSPVPAANRGVVLMAHYFGIYGNTVVLDHGYGLMSLYSHMSAIEVEEGQTVERGETLGRTGATGLAGGDHLHFTTMVMGLPVNPTQWWDASWIRDRVARKLGPALPFQADAGS